MQLVLQYDTFGIAPFSLYKFTHFLKIPHSENTKFRPINFPTIRLPYLKRSYPTPKRWRRKKEEKLIGRNGRNHVFSILKTTIGLKLP